MNLNCKNIVYLIGAAVFFFVATALPSAAQQSSSIKVQNIDLLEQELRNQGYNPDDGKQSATEDDIFFDLTKSNDDKYVLPNLPNLSKLYWSLGKFDVYEDKLIDYYLMINECELYLQYYHNDFEWAKIRQATRKHIEQSKDTFPISFEILSPLPLGRYDIDKEAFEVQESDKISGLRRLDFAMNMLGYKEICGQKGELYEYPPNMIIILNRPFILEWVPVKRELAKLYIEEAKSFYESLPPKLQLAHYERLSFIRLKITITQYKETIRTSNMGLKAVVFGKLDGIEVYADQDKMKPLYMKDFGDQRFRRLRRPYANDATDNMDDEEEDATVGKADVSDWEMAPPTE